MYSSRLFLVFYSILYFLIVPSFNSYAQLLPVARSPLFSTSGDCAVCHTSLTDSAGNDVSIDSHWRSTMMANSAKDPYFLAKVTSEIERFPAIRDIIEDTCAKCHMPMAHAQATADGQTAAMFDDGFINPDHTHHLLAQDGVSCTLCHQIQDEQLGEAETFSGAYPLDVETAKPDRLIFGPFENPRLNPMKIMSNFTVAYGKQLLKASLCATCHTLYTPYLDENGEVAGTFPEQTIFLEWRHSGFGNGTGEVKICQDCHMPDAEGGVATSIIPPFLTPKEPFGMHHFVGGNTLMNRILSANADELGITASSEHLDVTYQRTLDQLENHTADLSITKARIENSNLIAGVSIQIKTGHKYPAGFPSRRTWIHFKVSNNAGNVVFESGRPMDDGRIEGNNADFDLSDYEPHFETISNSDDVQIYESIMKNTEGDVTYALLSAAGYAKDNRLLPVGFDKQSAGDDFKTHGKANDDPDFVAGGDTVQYRVSLENEEGPFLVQVELFHQSIGFPFVEDLTQKQTGEIERFVQYYREADHTPVRVAGVHQSGIEAGTVVGPWEVY